MAHAHHHHRHHHGPDFGGAFAIGIALNTLFAALEAVAGLWLDSMALVADAGHNFSDVLGLAVAWAGASLARRPPSRRFTWGLRGSSVLASLGNAVLLLVALGAIAYESLTRLLAEAPAVPPGRAMMAVAAVGVAVNLATAMLFAGGRKHDLNIKGAYLHMAADAGVSAGVVVAGLLIVATGASWIDPAISLAIAAIILWNGWSLLRQSVLLSLGAVPEGIDPEAVIATLDALPGVSAVHDLHIWPLGTTDTVMTAHLVVAGGHPGNAFLDEARALLGERFGIGHVTLQIELDERSGCGPCD